MQTQSITEYAHALYAAHGNRAEHEAARKAKVANDNGAREEAERWQSIRLHIKELRGARQT
ncbi:hypothetical protein A8B78_07355 [Jannaschia sp. EhC01]|nr:hypothetical protein A8B78_07355 [Jannaschia sp. EhC01]